MRKTLPVRKIILDKQFHFEDILLVLAFFLPIAQKLFETFFRSILDPVGILAC